MVKKSVFQHAALRSNLVTQPQLDESLEILRAKESASVDVVISDDELAEHLVYSGIVSQYQAEQLKTGRTKFNLGPYIISDWVGQGGMGQVFKCVHEVLGRESAIKVLPLDKTTDYAISNFHREIKLQAKMDHPNLVRAFDAGKDGQVHFLVTEYVPGRDLRRLIRSQGALETAAAARVIMQVAGALHYAHREGLIHRDIKPGNILVTEDGTAKLSDLGLSGFADPEMDDPRAGKIVGTADYLAPELIQVPRETTCVSDIYSLGCTLYYAVTGKVPFPGGSARDKVRRHLKEHPLHPRQFCEDLSEEFVELIADMMEKDPVKRIQTADEVVIRLEPWAVVDMPYWNLSNMTPTPWTVPPVLKGPVVDSTMHETHPNGLQEASQGMLETDIAPVTLAMSAASQDTMRSESQEMLPPPLEWQDYTDTQFQWTIGIALALAVPAALVAGVVIGLLIDVG
ncbi:MAG: serine/threonine protein kinase [Planctomycetaceae bacterium]|jgi:eukaryotic-like serine/threonine-protein kinase|nr:serine/threonine protein kinase [Planctomycetaceae bacterium]MBT4847187.1 serine/threonine protein kinase [Planctomycetaceae bacterium]MBT5125723.1 serine/threonine protein kinase [Planctomycetaceae bacterium]MBT5598662.1 serine/threonine protein kinase [Planctomycetaceae bacterium]MBT5885340.1 serine/threonine protein kinase [Planctomycetaceae bacterium]